MNEQITFKNVYFSYKNQEIIKNLNITIDKKSFIGIKGENGSGKTTFLNLLLKLIKPDSGQIINTFKKKAFLDQITTTEDSFFPCTIKELVSLGYKDKLFSFMNKKDYAFVDSYLEKFGLLKEKNKQINELSGGQQQKVRLIKALISKPSLLVLDEPSSGIDNDSKEELNKLLDKLHKEEQMTIILVSHLSEDFKYVDKIYTLEGGILKC